MSAEALRRKQQGDEERAALADLREHGELIKLDLSEYHADGSFAWATANRGDGKGWGRQHGYETIDRLMHRGDVVLLQDGSRCQLAPKLRKES
jgi:hypothetical protein